MRPVNAEELPTCYRHPDRQTGLGCSNCGRPICAECMSPTPVGQRCPECVGNQRTLRPRTLVTVRPIVTLALIAANVLIFVGPEGGLGSGVGTRGLDYGWGALSQFELARGDWWRVISSMFMHGSVLHIAFNMYALYIFGPILETRFGTLRYALLYLVSGVWGAVGVLLLVKLGLKTDAPTIGASGAIFGLMGAIFVIERRHGSRVMSGVGGVIVINLALTFTLSNISVGGHLGGLAGGILCGLAFEHAGVWRRGLPLASIGAAAGLIAVAAGLIAYGST